jgi:DNA topoisomerase VI subunit B
MEHLDYVNKCSNLVKRLLFREGSLREALTRAAEECLENYPVQEVPYGDGIKYEELIDLLTDDRRKTISDTIKSMDDYEVDEIVEKIYLLNIELILDEAMEKVDNLWKTTYLRPMRFHN